MRPTYKHYPFADIRIAGRFVYPAALPHYRPGRAMHSQPSIQAPSASFHSRLWPTAPWHAPWQIVAVLTAGLALDARFGWPGQIATSIWAIAVFLWLMRRGGGPERLTLLACLAIATAGEVFCSLIWGLYDYQFHNVPAFVPPGHALLMTLGILWARRMPGWLIWLVPLAALPYVTAGWWQGWDTGGALLFVVFAVCLALGSAKRLYATMFLLSLLVEIYGTWLGNWAWNPIVPGTGLTSPNPPWCAGAFYCVLDMLVLATVSLIGSVPASLNPFARAGARNG